MVNQAAYEMAIKSDSLEFWKQCYLIALEKIADNAAKLSPSLPIAEWGFLANEVANDSLKSYEQKKKNVGKSFDEKVYRDCVFGGCNGQDAHPGA